MPRVLILGKIDSAAVALLRDEHGLDVRELPDHDPGVLEAARGADAVIVRMTRIDRPLVEAAPGLRVVARHGVGYEAVDVDALTARAIPLVLVGDVNSGAVAEHTLALMLAVAKRVARHDRAVRAGRFDVRDAFAASELSGATVLVVGFGRIGRRVASHCAAFEMRVRVHDPMVDAARIEGAGHEPVADLEAALANSDWVTVHVPKTPETERLLDAARLARLPRHAVVVNVSRGGIVDEAALHAAIVSGRLAGAALDVFDPEPPPPDNPLLALDEVVVSPHCAAFTRECGRRMGLACARNVLDALAGTLDPALVVNREVLARTAPGHGTNRTKGRSTPWS